MNQDQAEAGASGRLGQPQVPHEEDLAVVRARGRLCTTIRSCREKSPPGASARGPSDGAHRLAARRRPRTAPRAPRAVPPTGSARRGRTAVRPDPPPAPRRSAPDSARGPDRMTRTHRSAGSDGQSTPTTLTAPPQREPRPRTGQQRRRRSSPRAWRSGSAGGRSGPATHGGLDRPLPCRRCRRARWRPATWGSPPYPVPR